MAVDYCQRKAAKKQRRRLNDGKKKSNSDGAAGGEGGSSGKDKKSRPKRGRSGPRRLCKGMCFQVPKLLDDDITWRSNDDDGERGAKVYDPRAPPPPREAERAAAAAARLLESGAAEARLLLEREGGGNGGGGAGGGDSSGKRKRNRKKDGGAKVEAPATPSKRGSVDVALAAASTAVAAASAAAPPPRLSTGAGIDFPLSSSTSPSPSGALSHPTLDRSFDLSTLPLSLRMLAAACGLEAPTRVQSSAWAVAMKEDEEEEGAKGKGKGKGKSAETTTKNKNRNLLIVAPPGAGKTLAYLLPAAAKVVVEGEEEEVDDDEDEDAERLRRKRAKKASSSSSPPSRSTITSSPLPPSPRVLVLVPTRELARQVAAAARPLRRAAGLKVVRVAGGDRREDQVDKLRESAEFAKNGNGKGNGSSSGSSSSSSSSVHVLVATPGRLLDLVRGGDVGLGSIRTVVLDEADKMLSSAGIAEQLAEIRQALLGGEKGGQASPSSSSSPQLLQCMLVSATMPASVSRLASQWLGEGFASVGVGGKGEEEHSLARLQTSSAAIASSSTSNVIQVVTVCAEHKKPAKLLKHLARARQAASSAGERHAPRVLVFANRIKTVKFVAEFLRAQERKQKQLEEEEKKRGNNKNKNKNKGSKSNNASSSSSSSSSTKIETLHGDRSQPERDAALAAFRAGKVTVLVATDVAARGLDVSGLRHVVNYDFPSTLESYEHRVGRAGRDGKGGHVASFFGRALAPLARGVVEFLQGHGQGVDPNLVRLAEAYEEARERMMMEGVEVEEGEEEGEREAEDEDSEEGNEKDRERLRRSAAAKAAAAESKRGGAGKRKKKREVDGDAAVDNDEGGKDDASDEDEEGAAAPLLGLYRKASGAGGAAKTSTTSTAAKTSSAAKKKEKRKAVPGRLRQKLRREKAMRGQ